MLKPAIFLSIGSTIDSNGSCCSGFQIPVAPSCFVSRTILSEGPTKQQGILRVSQPRIGEPTWHERARETLQHPGLAGPSHIGPQAGPHHPLGPAELSEAKLIGPSPPNTNNGRQIGPLGLHTGLKPEHARKPKSFGRRNIVLLERHLPLSTILWKEGNVRPPLLIVPSIVQSLILFQTRLTVSGVLY